MVRKKTASFVATWISAPVICRRVSSSCRPLGSLWSLGQSISRRFRNDVLDSLWHCLKSLSDINSVWFLNSSLILWTVSHVSGVRTDDIANSAVIRTIARYRLLGSGNTVWCTKVRCRIRMVMSMTRKRNTTAERGKTECNSRRVKHVLQPGNFARETCRIKMGVEKKSHVDVRTKKYDWLECNIGVLRGNELERILFVKR